MTGMFQAGNQPLSHSSQIESLQLLPGSVWIIACAQDLPESANVMAVKVKVLSVSWSDWWWATRLQASSKTQNIGLGRLDISACQ